MITFVEQKDLKIINDNINKLFKAVEDLKLEMVDKEVRTASELANLKTQINQVSARVR